MEWKDKVSTFKLIDVRGIQGNFFQGLKKQALSFFLMCSLRLIIHDLLSAVHHLPLREYILRRLRRQSG